MVLSQPDAEPRPALLSRRAVLAGALAGTGVLLLGRAGFGGTAQAIGAPNGAALSPADANGWRLLPGFTSRVVAVAGQPVGATGHRWHVAPDGGATFAQPDGGWVYVSNSEREAGLGGAGMIRFAADGSITAAGPLLTGTSMNCSGGPTPWGTYLSCEEHPRGLVWELDPLGVRPAVARPALGAFQHEGLTADAERGAFYLTEDRPNGGLYRFRPDRWTDLSSGRLDVLAWTPDGVWWAPVPDPSASVTPTHLQRGDVFRFNGGEGVWYADGVVYFTTKGDGWVWRLELDELRLGVVYNPQRHPNPQLNGVDQLVVTPWGDLAVAEDGGDMQVVFVRQNGEVGVFAQLDGVAGSELTGLAFDPSGRRLYVSSQRNPGVTYELQGPFPPRTVRFEESTPGLLFDATWSTWNHPSQSAGAAKVTYTPGATLRATFVGPVLRWVSQRGPARAIAEVVIDDVVWARVDTYAATYRSRQTVFATSALSDGEHRLVIRHVGANPAATGTPALIVDAIDAAGLR